MSRSYTTFSRNDFRMMARKVLKRALISQDLGKSSEDLGKSSVVPDFFFFFLASS